MLNTISVSQLNTYVKSLVENDPRLSFISVTGEISNFKNHFSSGHWYFTLKDQNASIRCVMFRTAACKIKFNVNDGLAVVLKGRVSIYEKDGQYQFYAEDMQPVGEGDLALAFKQVKEKLEKEGLFDTSSKRELVKYPKRIAVVTSDTGAAVRDILNITSKRYPLCDIVMCPVLVQGDNAPKDIINTLDRVYSLDNIDAIIIGRGGGSAEDLHCFNDEKLARKIYESPFPVISAVGHETDFTICDFVSDVRASTPSHAAELVVPDKSELFTRVEQLNKQLCNKITYKFSTKQLLLDSLTNKFSKRNMENVFERKQLYLDKLSDKISSCINITLQNYKSKTVSLVERLDALSPLKILTRGFSVVSKDGKSIKSSQDLCVGDNISIKFYNGDVDCTVTKTNK